MHIYKYYNIINFYFKLGKEWSEAPQRARKPLFLNQIIFTK
jgi:hypothetical protein